MLNVLLVCIREMLNLLFLCVRLMSQLALLVWFTLPLGFVLSSGSSDLKLGVLDWTLLALTAVYPLVLSLSWRREAFLRRVGETRWTNLLAAVPLLWVTLIVALVEFSG